jgi:alcohol dehydrogenase
MTTSVVEAVATTDSGTWEVPLRSGRVVFGEGRLAEIGDRVRALGGSRALLVSDAGLCAAGHVDGALASLAAVGVETELFDGVDENPSDDTVAAGLEVARRLRPDMLVALGGGSTLDTTKGINFLLTNGGRLADYRGFGLAQRPMLPSVAVPSSAGTGSEAQSYAVLSDARTHTKMALGDDKAFFRTVILDPCVAATAPRSVAALAGFDALSHAVESYVTRSANPWSRLFAAEAWRRLDAHFLSVATGTAGLGDWAQMLWGAHLAGAAIEMSMLGAAHGCANPLTAVFGIQHGRAVALMLPAVVRGNAEVVGARYDELTGAPAGEGGERLAARLESLRERAGLGGGLSALGVGEGDLGALADLALEQWTLGHNPRPLAHDDVVALYREAL